MDRRQLLSAGVCAAAAASRPTLAWALAAASHARPARAQTATGAGLSEGYANGDGVRLYFVRAGDGPLMLFLHGHPDSGSLYEAQLREFSRDHLVVAPNLRGCPPSDAPDSVDAYAMPRLLGDLHGLLDHLGRERCVLVGNDWGGYIAWVFASAYPGASSGSSSSTRRIRRYSCASCAAIRRRSARRNMSAPFTPQRHPIRAGTIIIAPTQPKCRPRSTKRGQWQVRISRRISSQASQDRRKQRRCACACRPW